LNGRFEDAIASYLQALERKPDFHASLHALGCLYTLQRDYAAADSFFSLLAGINIRGWRAEGRRDLAYVSIAQGQLHRAITVLNEGLIVDRYDQVTGEHLSKKYLLQARLYAALGRLDSARVAVTQARKIDTECSADNEAEKRAFYIELLAREQKIDEARDSLDALATTIAADTTHCATPLLYAQGCLARATGDDDAAVEFFAKALAADEFHYHLAYAESCLRFGKLGEAVIELKPLINSFWYIKDGNILGMMKARYQLGVAYERSGWSSEATKLLEDFVAAWEHADAEIPELANARQRLARLAAGS
jgi:tetratricopeptide (TPR) repeat protein